MPDERVLLAVFLFYVGFVHGYIVRPFPKAVPTGRGQEMVVKLRMPGAVPKTKGQTMCTLFSLEDVGEINMIQWKVIGTSKIAHHLNVYGTEETFTPSENELEDPWECPSFEAIFVWCKNSPPTRLPPSIGFKVGGKHKIKTLILQVHYDHALSPEEADYSGHDITFTYEDQKYAAGFLLLHMSSGDFPPNQPKAHVDRCCKIGTKSHIFSFFVHTHGLGRLVTGYIVKKNTTIFREIGRGNPQWPQTFFSLREVIDVEPGDTLAVRGVFDSTQTNMTTYFGAQPQDGPPVNADMCNIDILYYTDPVQKGEPVPPSFMHCLDEPCASDLVFPDDANDFLPSNPRLEMHAKYGNQSGLIKINEKYSINLELQQL